MKSDFLERFLVNLEVISKVLFTSEHLKQNGFACRSGYRKSCFGPLKTIVHLSVGESSAGLQITAGQRTMSGQDDYLSGQNVGLAVILTGHVQK